MIKCVFKAKDDFLPDVMAHQLHQWECVTVQWFHKPTLGSYGQ